jgi:hypothetical protein
MQQDALRWVMSAMRANLNKRSDLIQQFAHQAESFVRIVMEGGTAGKLCVSNVNSKIHLSIRPQELFSK